MIPTIAEGYRKKNRLRSQKNWLFIAIKHTVEFELSLEGLNYKNLKQQKIIFNFAIVQ